MTQVLNVSTATATREAALRLAESAISAGLAAGGQVSGPVASFFWHEGQWRGSGTRAPAPPSAPWTGTPAGVNGVCAVRVDGRELRASTSHDATVRI